MKSTSHYISGWRHESRDDVIIHLIYYFALELYILIVRIWRIVKKLYLQRQPIFEYHHQNFSISIYGPCFKFRHAHLDFSKISGYDRVRDQPVLVCGSLINVQSINVVRIEHQSSAIEVQGPSHSSDPAQRPVFWIQFT